MHSRVLTLMLAIVLAFAGIVVPNTSAYADDGYTLTVSGAESEQYSAYQIATGTFSTDDDGNVVISNAVINESYLSTIVALIQTYEGYSDFSVDGLGTYATATAVLDAIADIGDQDFANALADALITAGVTATATATGSDGSVSFSGLAEGYYLVASTVDESDEDSYASAAKTSGILVEVYEDTTVAVKSSTPTATKTYNGDATYSSEGVTLSYTITTTTASNIEDYDTYKLVITDTLPTGITLEADEDGSYSNITYTVYLQTDSEAYTGSAINVTDGYTFAVSDDGGTITWTFSDLLALFQAASESAEGVEVADWYIVVEYSITLDADDIAAIYGSSSTLADSIDNTVSLTFPNDPYTDGEGTTETTPDSTAKTYIYTLSISKVSDDGETALTGAEFTITDSDGNEVGYDITTYTDGTASYFTFTGLTAGTYTITESTTPDGYKSIDPITFTIAETYDEDTGELSDVTVTETSDSSNAGTLSYTYDGSNATVVYTIVNVEGQDLPLTGAQGIALGIVAGAAVIAVSAFALVRRRREDEAEEA